MLKKVIVLAIILAVAVCALVACGSENETKAPETDPIVTDAPETEHVHEIVIEQLAATCQAEGYKRAVCTTCGEVVDSVTYGKSDCTPAAEATCTEDSVCAVCGSLIRIAKGHSFGEAVVVEATCQADGSKTRTCSECGETTVETTPMIAHNIPAANVTASVEATCTSEGSKTGLCTICNQAQTVSVPANHVVEIENLSALTVSDNSVQISCSLCGKNVEGTVYLSLSFDGEDVASELADWVTAENGLAYAEVHDPGQTSASVVGPTIKAYGDATDGHTSVLHIPHNRSGSIGFNGNWLSDAGCVVISFDWRITVVGGSINRVGAFGQTNTRNEGAVVEEKYMNAFRVDRSTGTLYANTGDGNFQLTVAPNEWHSVIVVMNPQTGEVSTYIDGKHFCTRTGDLYIITADGESSWRFGGKFNLFHKPEFDNFQVIVY